MFIFFFKPKLNVSRNNLLVPDYINAVFITTYDILVYGQIRHIMRVICIQEK